MKNDHERLSRICGMVASLSLISVTSAALAQQGEEGEAPRKTVELEEVVVTGSRIARPGVDTFYPAESLGSTELQDNGLLNIADALNEIPGFAQTTNPVGVQNQYALGQNFVDYLGLGSQRTLTVVDGRRFVSSNAPSVFGATGGLQVDFNVLPLALVDRIEVIGVGGAPIYGADAIAGTVNVIMKDRYEGIQGMYRFGTTEKGDGDYYGASLVFGTNVADGRGNVAVSAETYHQDGMLRSARPYFTQNNPYVASQLANGQTRWRVFREMRAGVFTDGGLVSNPGTAFGLNYIDTIGALGLGLLGVFPDGNFYHFDQNSNLIKFNPGQDGGLGLAFVSGGDGSDFLDRVQQARSELKRDIFTGRFNYDLTDGVRLFSDWLYAKTEARDLANQGWFQTFLFGGTSNDALLFKADHPFLSQQAQDLLAANGITEFWLHRLDDDVVNPSRSRTQNVRRIVGGLEGEFEFAGRHFNWEAYASHGETGATTQGEDIIDPRFTNAINVRRLTADDLAAVPASAILSISGTDSANVGDLVCEAVYQAAAGAITDLTFVNGCVPLNLFGWGVSSEAARKWVVGVLQTESKIEQKVYNVNFGGQLFHLPAGPFSFNIGYEKREEAASFTPDLGYEVGLGRIPASPATGGSYETDEFFGEILVPLTNPSMEIPALELLELNGAVRRIDNSIAGKATAWTAGGRYAPVRDITFRGNYTESLRAPSLLELYTPVTQTFSFADDPCDRRFVNSGPNPAVRRANCIAELGPGYDPETFESTIVGATRPGFTGGNPNLDNEVAKSYSIGITIQPRWVENLTITADYIKIKLDQAIQSLDLTTIMKACYDSPSAPNVAACQSFTRDSSFQIIDFRTGQTNAALYEVEFANYMVSYGFDLSRLSSSWANKDLGTFTSRLRLSNTIKREVSVTGDPVQSEVGEFLDPEWSGVLDLYWDWKDTRVAYRLQWQPASKVDATGDMVFQYPTPSDPNDATSNIVKKTDAWYMSNLSVSHNFGRFIGDGSGRLVAQLAINNLFDRRPDTMSLAWQHYSFDEFLGRQFSFSVQAEF